MKKILMIFILTGFLVFFSVLGSVTAANLTVSPGGSIQAVVNSASANDTILVNDNNGSAYTYIENVFINKRVNLQANSDLVTVQASNSSHPVFTINSDGNGTTIQSFIIAEGFYGVYLDSASNCFISNNTLSSNIYGIFSEYGDFNTITGNLVVNNTNAGVVSRYWSENNIISDNTLRQNGFGLHLLYSSNNLVNNNHFDNNYYYGIYVDNSQNNLIRNNLIQGSSYAGVALYFSANTNYFTDNNFTDNGFSFFSYQSHNNTLLNNNLSNNAFYGVYLDNSDSNILINNSLSSNPYAGLAIYNGSDDNQVGLDGLGNIISSNGFGVYITDSSNTTVLSNVITFNNGDGIFVYNSSTSVHFNQIVGNVFNGLECQANSIVNATNNWWGKNNPLNSSTSGCDIYQAGGSVNHETWLMLNLTGSVIHVTKNNNSTSEITADFTLNNHGEDTSTSGTIPDGVPVTFSTTLGSVTPTATTRRGKATVTLTSSPTSGVTTVTASTFNQTVFKDFRKSFSNIQAAINSSYTLNGDVILVENGTYVENVVVSKNLTIVSEGNVTVHALNPSQPVFKINSSSSGSLIQGFVISGAVNSFGLYLVGCSNCSINYNTITNNCIGVGTSATKTENNVIMYNNITSNQVGLGTSNSHNYVIYENTITYNSNSGIKLLNSNNTVISTNLIMENNSPGNLTSGICLSNSNNTVIQNNLIPGNMFGLDIEQSVNCTVKSNLITDGIVGILTYNSSANINFNRIFANRDYGLYNEHGNINATNNWWGSNNNPLNSTINICNVNGNINTTSWLILSIDPSSTVNSGGNASIIGDLTHNNLGQDTSTEGHVMNGIPINFTKTSGPGSIISPACTIKGQAVAILNLGTTTSQTVTVSASLNNQTVSQQMTIAPGVTILNITSSTLNSTTLQPISLTYTMPLNSSVTWLSVLWKTTYVFYGELQIIVNGVVVKSTEYVNPGYNTWRGSGYRDDVFRAIIYANNCILQDRIDPTAIPVSFWNNLTSLFNLTSTELQFIQNHRLEFMDNLTVKLTYPGAFAPAIAVTDPMTNSTINLNFPGNNIHRISQITYMNGIFIEPAGYEGVKSFAIATTQVTDSIAQYWADQKNATDSYGNLCYQVGPMKAAYGTFFTALMMIYCHDILADTAANEFNVIWTRTHPVAVSVGDDAYQTYLTLECDHSMGMTVMGSLNNIKLFNSACSSHISTIEYGIMRNLDFSYQYADLSMDAIGSVARDMFYAFWTGTDLELFSHNGYTVMKLSGRDDLILLYDPETGIMRDVNTINGYSGAYCFRNLQTELSYDFFGGVKNSTSAYRDWADEGIDDFIYNMGHINMSKITSLVYMGSDFGKVLIDMSGFMTGVVIAAAGVCASEILIGIPVFCGGIFIADYSLNSAWENSGDFVNDYYKFNSQPWFN